MFDSLRQLVTQLLALLQVRIELPYSLFPANGEMCLIVKDPQRVYKDRVRYSLAVLP